MSAHAVEFFAQRFGPYPYASLALTQMPGDVSQGWPSLIFLSSFSFLTPTEKSELHMSPLAKSLSDNVIPHETAHQWWGDLVSWKSYRDQWLAEALATYSSLMLLESNSPNEFRAIMEKYRQDLLAKNKDGSPLADAGPVTFGTRLNSSHFPEGYEAVSYGRGTWLFHMLRYMMRDANLKGTGRSANPSPADEPFVRALRRVREHFQEKSIDTRELLRVFEEELPPSLWYEGKKSLDWFYEGWINGTAIPRFELQSVKYNAKPGGTVVTGTILQSDAPKDLVTAVPVYAVLGGKECFAGTCIRRRPRNQLSFVRPRRHPKGRTRSQSDLAHPAQIVLPSSESSVPENAQTCPGTNSLLLQRCLAQPLGALVNSPPITRLLLMRDKPKMEIEVHNTQRTLEVQRWVKLIWVKLG